MKFLLVAVNAKFIHSNPAVYSLRAFAGEERQPYIEIAEYTINHQMENILGDLYHRKPDVIGFSCYIWNWVMIRQLLPEIAKILPQTRIWLGGPEVSFDAKEILEEYPMVTGIMLGEGEVTFTALLDGYLAKERGEQFSLETIPGLMLPMGETGQRELTQLSQVPFFYDNLETFANRILYYESSRGCPFRCSYCLSSIDKTVRLRDLDLVKKELQFFLDNKVSQVKFIDRTFNCDHNHAMTIWQYIHSHDNGITNFHFEIAGDLLNQEELELLGKMRPGLVQLEVGVQTTKPQTLAEIRRHTDQKRLEQNVETIRLGNNIHQHLDLIAGLPFEDYQSFQHSFDEVYQMKPNQLQLGFLKVLKGSYMQEKAADYGLVCQSEPPYEVLYTKWLSFGEVLQLKRIEEMVELYYNSNQFTNTLSYLVPLFVSPFVFFETLAKYYEDQGYFVSSPARGYRYQILLSFAEKYQQSSRDLVRELLTFDFYLREKGKSRPDFATDVNCYREEIREIQRTLPSKTMHVEAFLYPVWRKALLEQGQAIEKAKEPTYLVFDYDSRSPLSHDASVSFAQTSAETALAGREGDLCQH